MLSRIIERLMSLRVTDEIISQSQNQKGMAGIFQKILDHVEIGTEVDFGDLEKIPRTGPLIVVANHPTGFAEGLAIPALLDSVRDDLTVMGHTYFRRWPALASRMILVNPQASTIDKRANSASLTSAVKWLRNGHCLVVFPAGEVARPQTMSFKCEELPWRPGLVHLVQLSGAAVLPIHVSGNPGFLFRLLSRIHPRLGTIVLCREFLRRSKGSVRLKVGSPILSTKRARGVSLNETIDKYRQAVLDLGKSIEEEMDLSPIN